MILIIYNLTIVINFNSCMFIIMIIMIYIMTYRGCLSPFYKHTYILFCYSIFNLITSYLTYYYSLYSDPRL